MFYFVQNIPIDEGGMTEDALSMYLENLFATDDNDDIDVEEVVFDKCDPSRAIVCLKHPIASKRVCVK